MAKKANPAAKRASRSSPKAKSVVLEPKPLPIKPVEKEEAFNVDLASKPSISPGVVLAVIEIASIQVTPFTQDEQDDVTIQPGGPDANTEGWAVYGRFQDGTVVWIADTAIQTHAELIGHTFAKLHEVGIEPYPWLNQGA